MTWTALNCPQCSAPLPRVAIWRAVKCGSCGALITRNESMVLRDSFRKAHARAQQEFGAAGGDLECGGERYRLMEHLGKGEFSEVYRAQRVGGIPFLATIKVSSASGAAGHYAREAEVLTDLRDHTNEAGRAFCAQNMPLVIAQGPVKDSPGKHALVMHHEPGYWGSLAALQARFPQGVDPRHAVWIWRRMLDVLNFIHLGDWAHGDVRPEHALIHPEYHGVRLIGWASAIQYPESEEKVRDMQRCARIIRVLLCGADASGTMPPQVPRGLAELVTTVSEDASFCRSNKAKRQDALLQEVAKEAFGTPQFLPLNL